MVVVEYLMEMINSSALLGWFQFMGTLSCLLSCIGRCRKGAWGGVEGGAAASEGC